MMKPKDLMKKESDTESNGMDRRSFLQKAGAVTGSAALASGCASLPTKPAAILAGRKLGANDKINVGLIGAGGRGTNLLKNMLELSDHCNIVAICDVYNRRVDRAVKICKASGFEGIKTFEYHTDVIDLPEVDAIFVATPDHWHATIALAAMHAGKDVYCEKPMTHTIPEAKMMAETMERLGRIVQVGSQTTSADQWWKAKELIQQGAIGKLLLSQGSYHRNSDEGEWNWPIDATASPHAGGLDHINWDHWQGPARHQFEWSHNGPDRFFRFRKYWDYSGGIATDLFFHVMAPLNICWPQPEFPFRATGMGGIYEFDDGREVPDTFMLNADYPSGHSVVLSSSMANAHHIPGLIRGHEGTIVMVKHGMFEAPIDKITCTPESKLASVVERFKTKFGTEELDVPIDKATHGGIVQSHIMNFFDSMHSRELPRLNARVAYHVQVAITLAVESYKQGKVMFFDAEREVMTDRCPAYAAKFNTPGWTKTLA